MCSVGMLGGVLGYLGSSLGPITLGAHTMLGSSLLVISGYQAVIMHLLSLDLSQKLEISKMKKSFLQILLTSHSAKIGFFLLLSGVLLWGGTFISWQSTGFGPLDYGKTMKVVIPGATLISIALEMMIFTFFGRGLNWK